MLFVKASVVLSVAKSSTQIIVINASNFTFGDKIWVDEYIGLLSYNWQKEEKRVFEKRQVAAQNTKVPFLVSRLAMEYKQKQ